MAILVTRVATAVSSRKTPKMEINRNFRGLLAFSANVARDKTEEQEIPVPWSKVPRALEPVNRVRAILVTRLAAAVSSRKTPKMEINRNFRGLLAFSANVARDKTEEQEIPVPWSRVPRVLEPLKPGYGHFSHPADHGRFKPKNTQNGNKSQFPGATCIFSKCCERQNRRARNSGPMVKSAARFGARKSSYGHFSHPGGHGRFKPKNTQDRNKSRFPGATCIFSKCCERQKRSARNSASHGQKCRAFWSP